MTRLDSSSRQRLAVIGIDVWSLRASAVAADQDAESSQPRVRLLSGAGDWLLVQSLPWRGQHEQLLADIKATIGIDRCRFGQWAGDSTAGVGMAEMSARGIARILAFGEPPERPDWQQLIIAPALEELADSADARRQLWQRIAPVLER